MPRKNPRPKARQRLAHKRLLMEDRERAMKQKRRAAAVRKPPGLPIIPAIAFLLGWGDGRG